MTTSVTSPAPALEAPERTAPAGPAAIPATTGKLLAVLRILVGFMFVWDFFDKTFGLGIGTPPAQSWLAGVSPTAGYLQSLHGTAALLESLAGQAWVDWAFMLGLLLLGGALMLGIGLRAAATGGTILLALLWLSSVPTKNNPFVDEHVILALLLWVFLSARSGNVWGFSRTWLSFGDRAGMGWLSRLG